MPLRTWRQDLNEARRARRSHCDVCDLAGVKAIAIDVFAYAIRPSRSGKLRDAAQLDTEERVEIAVCPRHLRSLKAGRVLVAGKRALALTRQERSGRSRPGPSRTTLGSLTGTLCRTALS